MTEQEMNFSSAIDEANQMMDHHEYQAAKALLRGASLAVGGLSRFSDGLRAAYAAAISRTENAPLSPEEMTASC